MDPDGSHRRALTHDSLLEVDPAWSADGREIAVAALAEPHQYHSDVWRMLADGSRRERLTHQPEGTMAVSPVWSPDGTDIAFARLPWYGPDGAARVWVIDRDGRGARAVGEGIPLSWSPNGEILVLRDGQGLWALDPESGRSRTLVPAGDDGSWSRDGSRLACVTPRDGGSSEWWNPAILWIGTGEGSRLDACARFEDGGAAISSPRWTGDGRHLVYSGAGKQCFGYAEESAVFAADPSGRHARPVSQKGLMNWMGGGRTGIYLLRLFAPAWRAPSPKDAEFFDALQHNDPANAKRLAAKGINPNARGIFEIPALTEAIGSGDLELIRLLLRMGADVNAQTLYGSSHHSALVQAVGSGNAAVIRILLDAGAEADAPVWEEAAGCGDRGMLDRLRARFGRPPAAALAGAASRGNVPVLNELLREGINPDARGVHGSPAIVEAAGCVDHSPEMLQALLDRGADVNATSTGGRTALMEAAHWGNLDAVRLLIRHGANVNATDRFGTTPLLEAAGRGEFVTLRFLLEHGARWDACDWVGDSALTKAALGYVSDFGNSRGEDQTGILRFLLDAGLNVNRRSRDGLTPLMASAQVVNGDERAAELFLQRGADPSMKDIDGKTAITWARKYDLRGDSVTKLLRRARLRSQSSESSNLRGAH